MTSFMQRLKKSWNVLTTGDIVTPETMVTSSVPSASYARMRYDSSRSVLAPILTRIAIDAAAIPVKHVILDETQRLKGYVPSELDDRLNIMANVDQTGPAFIQDAIMTMLETGACALVPIETSAHPSSGRYDILSMRVAEINQWFNYSVEVDVYNEQTGDRTQKILPKSYVAIAYNPMYAVMNAPNSTLTRLVEKLALLDVNDNRAYSAQLDLLLQLPFTLKGERRQEEAERRVAQLEEQLNNRKYGIAYIDATEKATQLNRPVTNALFETIDSLTESLHAQLGLTPAIFSGTASQEEILLYNNRTVLPVIKAITSAMVGAFFSKTAVTQGHSIQAYPKLFKMAPLLEVADAADKLTRNEIMTSNEVRAEVGLEPSKDPEADTLRNKNLNKAEPPKEEPKEEEQPDEEQKDDEE
jgi:hypothetical protein